MADDPKKVKLDFKVCIVCQKNDKVALVKKPAFASFAKVLTCLEEWASCYNLVTCRVMLPVI